MCKIYYNMIINNGYSLKKVPSRWYNGVVEMLQAAGVYEQYAE